MPSDHAFLVGSIKIPLLSNLSTFPAFRIIVDIKPLHGNWKWKKYSIINSQLHRINNWLEWDSFLLPSMQDDKISISLVTNEYNKHFLSHCSFFTKGNDKKLTEERETLTRGHTSALCLFNYSNIASSICRTKSSVMIRCSCAKMKPSMKKSRLWEVWSGIILN